MIRFCKKIFKYNQTGEIATVLISSVKENLAGFFMGRKFGKEVQKQSQSYKHQSYSNHCPHAKFIKIYHNRSSIFTKLCRGSGGLVVSSLFRNFESDINKRNSYQSQRKCDNDIRVKIPEIKISHRSFLSNLYDTHKQNVPNNRSKVNNPTSFIPLIGQKLGETTIKLYHPADKFINSPDNVFCIAFLSFLPKNSLININLTRRNSYVN